MKRIALLGSAALWLCGGSSLLALEYEKDIMPIFMEKCADCHSAKGEKIKGGLKLDDPKHFHERFSKNDVVIPGDWDASYLFVTLFRPPEAKEAMPPKGKGERLTMEEVILVQRWISEGAPINGTRGERGEMPENPEDMFLDLGGLNPFGESGAKPAMPEEPELKEEDWTNNQNQTIRATLLGVEGNKALLKMPDGTVHKYPIAQLSKESQARVMKRHGHGHMSE